ncbi:hypothetical protein [Chamaesiphon sp.]
MRADFVQLAIVGGRVAFASDSQAVQRPTQSIDRETSLLFEIE